MHVLFVHSNFPAQFRCVAPRLASDYGWTCTFATANAGAPPLPGVEKVVYRPAGGTRAGNFYTRPFDSAVAHARGVYEAMKARPDVRPDLVVAHSGFGSSLFLPFLYDAPIINFFEYFYRPVGQDLGYRPETPVTEPMLLRSRARNGMILSDLDNCDRGWSPNFYQRGLFPPEHRDKIEVIPEGVDTQLYRRGPDVRLTLPGGRELPPATRVVTYVSRGFELMRGFDIFMEAAKRIYEQVPETVFIVVGSDRASYGADEQFIEERSFRAHVLRSGEYDLSRFCFTGRVPEETLARILSVSDLHVYLTVPFVPSWSLLDAMSCSCVVLASDQACTREFIGHGQNGLLSDFFDHEGIARQAAAVLREPQAYRGVGESARRTVEERYALDVTLPRIKTFFERVAATPRRPSLLAHRLIRTGTLRARDEGKKSGRATVSPPSVFVDTSVAPAAPPRPVARPSSKVVLFCWELGGGLGHMLQMLPLAQELRRRGHCVFMALRDASAAVAALGAADIMVLQSPYKHIAAGARRPTYNLAHILMHCGWDDRRTLFSLASAWRNLFAMARPDLIVCDYSPTALLASRGLPARRALIGSGFCCPPDTFPLPAILPGRDPERLAEDETRVLRRANAFLAACSQPPLGRLGRLFSQVDENFLTTLPELEQYRGRAKARYWGPVTGAPGGKAPEWPAGEGPRVFAYLKRFDGLAELLKTIGAKGFPTVVYVDGLDAKAREDLASPTVRLEPRRVDLARAARECDLAVLHAGQGTTAQMLLAGKPLLQIPTVLEQQLTARAVERLGAGMTASYKDGADVAAKLDALLASGEYAEAARRFAAKYADFDPAEQVRRMVERVEELLNDAAGRAGPSPARERARVPAGVFRA